MNIREFFRNIRDKVREMAYKISEPLSRNKYGELLIQIFSKIYFTYDGYLQLAGIGDFLWPEVILVLAIVGGTIGFVIGSILTIVIHNFCKIIPISILLPILCSIAIIDLIVGGPYFLASRVREEMERYLPDALKQFSSTIKAGGTYTFAIKEITTAGYGKLSKEFEKILKELREGLTLQKALNNFAERSMSKLIKRTIRIMIDAIESGGGLAKVMDSIAEDVRQVLRIQRERIAKTTMQSLLLTVAGILLAPAIFGMVIGILYFLITTSAEVAKSGLGEALKQAGGGLASAFMKPITKEDIERALQFKDMMYNLFLFYALIESALTCVAVSIIRESKPFKAIIYLPFAMLITYILYNGGILLTALMLGL